MRGSVPAREGPALGNAASMLTAISIHATVNSDSGMFQREMLEKMEGGKEGRREGGKEGRENPSGQKIKQELLVALEQGSSLTRCNAGSRTRWGVLGGTRSPSGGSSIVSSGVPGPLFKRVCAAVP